MCVCVACGGLRNLTVMCVYVGVCGGLYNLTVMCVCVLHVGDFVILQLCVCVCCMWGTS